MVRSDQKIKPVQARLPIVRYEGGENSCMRIRSMCVHVDFEQDEIHLRARIYQHVGKRGIVWGGSVSSKRFRTIKEIKQAIEHLFTRRVRAVYITYDKRLNTENEMFDLDVARKTEANREIERAGALERNWIGSR